MTSKRYAEQGPCAHKYFKMLTHVEIKSSYFCKKLMFPICLVSEIIYICNQRKFKYLFRRRYFCSIRLAKVKALTRLYGHLCLIIL